MRDELVRAITADGLVKAVAITGRDLVERARQIHTLPSCCHSRPGPLSAGSLHAGRHAERGWCLLTLQIKGGGPLRAGPWTLFS